MTVARPKIGLFAAIFNDEGKLLVKRRQPGESLAGEWDLPGGEVEEENNKKALDERIIGKEIAREILEETGLNIQYPLNSMPAMYPAVIKGGDDWAFLIYVGNLHHDPGTLNEWRWVSLYELNELARGQEGNRIVSGWGKRMHRLCLMAFILNNGNYKASSSLIQLTEPGFFLRKIQETWVE